ncbi:MAG: PIG-L family deacetylase [Lachnospiraceae bacterium]|nr:PIG-L family deacetylase [Lachnospiraceae bacterium]
MSITKLAIRFAAPVPKVESFTRYLFIGPHPDDIEIGAGATISRLAKEGKQIRFLICTDGRYGDGHSGGITGDDLAALRKKESIASAAALGVEDVHFLDLCDGGFYKSRELIKQIAKEVGKYKPDIIFAPDPTPTSECHIDHLNVGKAARQIACFAPYPGIMERYKAEAAPVKAIAFYMTAKPNRFVKTGQEHLNRQLAAIFTHHKSQYPEGSADASSIRLYLKLRAADFGVRSLHGCAEGFRVLGQTQMHCLPEAGD